MGDLFENQCTRVVGAYEMWLLVSESSILNGHKIWCISQALFSEENKYPYMKFEDPESEQIVHRQWFLCHSVPIYPGPTVLRSIGRILMVLA